MMILKKKMKNSLLFLFVVACSHLSAQNIGNRIMNDVELQPIKDKINNADSSAQLIKVLHIGDSHIKAGIFSQAFMEKLNDYYAEKRHGNLFFNFQWFCKIGTKYSD